MIKFSISRSSNSLRLGGRFLAVLFVLLSLSGAVFAQTGAPINVVSWNLEWFPGHRPTASAAEATKHMADAKVALKQINPDVFIGLELHDWEAFKELCSAIPGLTPLVVTNFRDPETGAVRPQQIGIAAKLKCHASGWEPWKANVPNIPRGFAYAALEDPVSHKLILVYGNHLKSNRGSDQAEGEQLVADMRNEQAAQLIQNVEETKTVFGAENIRGWIVAGDLNTNHDGQYPQCHVIEKLVAAGFLNTWAKTPKEKRLTWRGDTKGRYEPTTFDYILARGFGDNLQAAILDTPRNVSDHYAISLKVR